MVSADDILNFDDQAIEKLVVPEWGNVELYIRTMTGVERDTWEMYAAKAMERKGAVNIRAKLACLCLCDETGKRIFADGQVDHLGKKSSKALDRIYSAALKLNKLSDDEIEALEKN